MGASVRVNEIFDAHTDCSDITGNIFMRCGADSKRCSVASFELAYRFKRRCQRSASCETPAPPLGAQLVTTEKRNQCKIEPDSATLCRHRRLSAGRDGSVADGACLVKKIDSV